MYNFLQQTNAVVWGIPALVLILSIGLWLSVRTSFAQFRLFPKAMKNYLKAFKRNDKSASTSSQALYTALAATVGTGNIAGVAGAIALGGPGSVFWMWVCAAIGMILKFSEAALAVRFHCVEENGNRVGGPMYYIEKGMGKRWRPMAVVYALCILAAAMGMGSATQVNAVIGTVEMTLTSLGVTVQPWMGLLIGLVFAACCGAVVLGGAGRIGNIADVLVPVIAAGYIALCVGAIGYHRAELRSALSAILCGAFSPRAFTGGAVGSFYIALRTGAARGIFSNEAGMGTAAMAHGSAAVQHPQEQGLMGIVEVFIDTVIICTMTALVILTSGTQIPYGSDEGIILTVRSFSCTYGHWVNIPLAIFISVFAFATVLGWGVYGIRCAQYLFGRKAWKPFVWIQIAVMGFSGSVGTGTIWTVSEIFNGFLIIPNLIALAALHLSVEEAAGEINQEERQKQASGKSLPTENRLHHVRSHGRESPESFRR